MKGEEGALRCRIPTREGLGMGMLLSGAADGANVFFRGGYFSRVL